MDPAPDAGSRSTTSRAPVNAAAARGARPPHGSGTGRPGQLGTMGGDLPRPPVNLRPPLDVGPAPHPPDGRGGIPPRRDWGQSARCVPQGQRAPTVVAPGAAAARPVFHHHPSDSPTSATSPPPITAKTHATTIHRRTRSPSCAVSSPATTGPRAGRPSGIAYLASRHGPPRCTIPPASFGVVTFRARSGHPIAEMTTPRP